MSIPNTTAPAVDPRPSAALTPEPLCSLPDLLPCPFCGGKVEILGEDVFETMIYCRPRRAGGYYFECPSDNCRCSLGYAGSQDDLDLVFGVFDTKAKAVTAWNTRSAENATSAATATTTKPDTTDEQS